MPCPRGADINSLGYVATKRNLWGGCMIPADSWYDPLAEVHVPAMCSEIKLDETIHQGCMQPGAENFDADANSPTFCKWIVKGCTDPNALNYNPDATVAETDPDLVYDGGGCIEAVPGCTLSGATPY